MKTMANNTGAFISKNKKPLAIGTGVGAAVTGATALAVDDDKTTVVYR